MPRKAFQGRTKQTKAGRTRKAGQGRQSKAVRVRQARLGRNGRQAGKGRPC
jgi:hypothetical protein